MASRNISGSPSSIVPAGRFAAEQQGEDGAERESAAGHIAFREVIPQIRPGINHLLNCSRAITVNLARNSTPKTGATDCILEAERIKYAIRLPATQVLQGRIGYLLKRPVRRPPNEVRRFHANFTYQAGSCAPWINDHWRRFAPAYHSAMLRREYLFKKLTAPIPTKDGGTLRTIQEVCEYVAAIGKERELRRHWQQVRELILQEADAAAVSWQLGLAVLKDAKLNVAALERMRAHEPPPGLLPNGGLNVVEEDEPPTETNRRQ